MSVITLVITMETKIIRIGNSLGARYSRKYLDSLGVKEGDRVRVSIVRQKPNNKRAVEALRAIAKMDGVMASIDVERWQAERRAEWAKREEQFRDILGR